MAAKDLQGRILQVVHFEFVFFFKYVFFNVHIP